MTELDFSLIKKDPADARRLIFAAVQRARDLPGVKTAAVGTMLPYGNFTNSRRIMSARKRCQPIRKRLILAQALFSPQLRRAILMQSV